MFTKSFISVFFLCLALTSVSQYHNLNFRKYTAADGMPSDEVECIFQDSKGYVWTGTRFGVSIFDGNRFRKFQHDPLDGSSLGGSRVLEIKEDGRGDIWLVIENFGLSRINRITFEITNFKIPVGLEPEERYINTILIENDTLFWVGTERGIKRFNPSKGSYVGFSIPTSAQKLVFVSIQKDRFGNHWALTYEGALFYWTREGQELTKFNEVAIEAVAYKMNILDDTAFVINTSKGLFVLKPYVEPARSVLSRSTGYPHQSDVTAFSVDESGNWWVSNATEGVQIFFPKSGFLQKLNINWLTPIDLGISLWHSIVVDAEGGIWLGGEDGLFHFNPKYNHFRTYPAISKFNEQFSFGKIVGISNEGNEVIAVSLKGIAVFDREKSDFVNVRFSPELHKKPIFFNGISRKSKGVWWLSSSKGILELKRLGDHFELIRPSIFKRHRVLGSKEVYALSFSVNGDCWFATPNAGLFHYNERSGKIRNITSFGTGRFNMQINHLDFVSTDASDGVLVGHHRGFAVLLPGDTAFRQVEELADTTFDFSTLSVYDIDYLFGEWWIATESHGLWRFDPRKGKLRAYTMKDGLISNSITAVHRLGTRRIAIGTDKGLSILNVSSGKFVTYLRKDGLPSNQFQVSADHDAGDGEVFMATTEGVVSFHEDELKHTVFTPRMDVFAISVNGRPMSDSLVHQFTINPDLTIGYRSGITIAFSSLNFLGNADFDLRFKLSEDGDWKISQSTEILSLYNLDPGNYNVAVQFISKNTGVMSGRFNFRLTVIPPFWKAGWFYALCSLVVILILFFLFKFKTERTLRLQQKAMERQKLIEQERVRIAMDLHDDIGGNLTALNLMTALLGGMELPEFSRQIVAKIGEASDRMVQDMNEIVWALNINNDSLKSLMSYIRQYLSNTFTSAGMLFEMEEPQQYPDIYLSGKTRRNLFMIIKEAANNAIKYSGSHQVDMRITVDETLVMMIRDHGVGIPDEATKNTISGGGNGINNMRKRADDLGATITFINEKGLTVIVSVPLQLFSESTDQII